MTKSASSSSWGGSPTSFLTRNTCLWLARERKLQKDLRKRHRSPLVVALNVLLCSLDANISVVAPLPRTKDRSGAKLRKRTVSFAACSLCGLPTFYLDDAAENNWQE